jgi:regulation of enolase protein 1 (concanavalin A-like superfamily)
LKVTVTLPQQANVCYGDQAGIFLYLSDSRWVKLVVEGDKQEPTTGRMIVLAHMPSDQHVMVVKKWENVPSQAHRLQIELRRGAGCCVVIASVDGNDAFEFDVSLAFADALSGVLAHLNLPQARLRARTGSISATFPEIRRRRN